MRPLVTRLAEPGSKRPAVPSRVAVAGDEESVTVALVGGFELRLVGEPVTLSAAPRRVLGFLALQRRRPLARAFVAQSLWPDSTEKHADGNLRTALWKLGRFDRSIVDQTTGHLALASSVVVDFELGVGVALRLISGDVSHPVGDPAEAYLLDDVLPDWYDEWALVHREYYRQLRLHALERLCRGLTQIGEIEGAICAGLACVAAEPLRESANVLLMQAYVAEGNPSEAVRHFRRYRRLLCDELGMEPATRLADVLNPPPMR